MKSRTCQKMDCFFSFHQDLQFMKEDILKACMLILDTYRTGGKLLICGNGGSCADSDHIVGELMKGFLLKRPLEEKVKGRFKELFGEDGQRVSEKLQGSLPAISLNVHSALYSAFSNDVDASVAFAQQVMGYAKAEDILLGISTSGNSENVYYAFITAKVKEIKCIALTGMKGGKLAAAADCCLIAPSSEICRIQEYHLIIYHFICAFIESEMFEE